MDDDEILFAVLVSDVARLLRTELDRRGRDAGLTRSQWLALSRLARFPGVSLSSLAEMLEMEKAPAGRLIDRLEEGGWVRREPDPDDRRIKRLYPRRGLHRTGDREDAPAGDDRSAGQRQRRGQRSQPDHPTP